MTRFPPVFKAQCQSQVLFSVCVCVSVRDDLFKTCFQDMSQIDFTRLLYVCWLCVSSSSVCKKHGKLVTFLRSFMKSRPPPQKLRQRGILRERVFGCDLGEHLHNSGHEGKMDFYFSFYSESFLPAGCSHFSVNCWKVRTNPKAGITS